MRKFALIALAALIPIDLSAARLTLRDGTVIYGQFVNGSPQNIVFQDDTGMRRRFDLNQVQTIDFGEPAAAANGNYRDQYGQSRNNPYNQYNNGQPQYNAQPQYNDQYNRDADGNGASREDMRAGSRFAVLPPGSQISVRTDGDINAQNALEGRTFPASITQDVIDPDGRIVIPRGSPATLIVRRVNEGSTLSNGSFVLDLDSVQVNGRRYVVSSTDIQANDPNGIGKNKRTAEMVGGGAVLGTLLGAIAGGGKGAAIGMIAGAAAGGGAQVLTKGHELRVPAETILTFRLDRPLELKESR